ncbi:hypothetical protein WJX77_004910 [Trebouxia sp. C0004]
MKRKLPPALPWRPVTDLPPPGVFCAGEPQESYAFLPSATVSRAPAQASRDQNKSRAAPALAAVILPTVFDPSSDDEVLSAEQPHRGLKRSRAAVVATTANAAGSAAAGDAAEADQPARKLAQAKHMPCPASAQPYESGQLSPSEHSQDLPAPAAAPETILDPGPAPVQTALPALPLGPAQHLAPPQDTKCPKHAVDPHGVAPNCNCNVQERMAAVLGIRTPAKHVALRDAAGPTLADLLNPNNAAYDPEFAAQHRAMRAQANPVYAHQKARKQVNKLIKHWDKASAFTVEEHGYVLDLHGVHLEGKDAGRFDSLKARMAIEQREYLKQLRLKAFVDPHRYTSCHPEAAHQIEAELAAQRNLVQDLPKLWQLAKLFSLKSIVGRKPRDSTMSHLATISRQGLRAVFSMPQPLTPIPLDQPCMPSLLTQRAAVSGPLPAFNTDHPNMPPIAPTTTTAQTDSTQGLADVPLHRDGVCNSNPACLQADLLMTEGAFECLTGTWAPSYRLGWELPVIIRAKNTARCGDSQTCLLSEQHAKQVIIDSPLPRRMLNLREKHELLYQHAVTKLGHDLWTRQQHARQAAQASMGDRPSAHQQPVHQQQQQQQLAEEHMYAPYSPSNDPPVDAPYSPSTDPDMYDQKGMYNMPNSLTPTAADLPSASMDAAPYPMDAAPYPMQGSDGVDADGSNSEANAFAHAVLGDGQDEPGSVQAQTDASAADPSAGGSADAEARAEVDAAAGNDPCTKDGPHRVAATAAGATELNDGAKGTTGGTAREAGIGYDSWQLGPYKLVIRTQLPAHLVHNPPPLPPGQPPPGPTPMRLRNKVGVVGVKMEYLEEWGFEMLLPDELARWWAAILLHPQPNCELVVAKVGVHSSHLLGIQAKSRSCVMQECHREHVDMSHVQRLIPLLMGHLQGLAPGQYLLTHQPGADAVSCFTAQINDTQDEPGSLGVPLPCGPLGVRTGTDYDLHAAHVNSGATDTEQDLFAGAWQQADPDIDQVPFTFPPVQGPSKMGRGKRAKRGIFRGRGAPRQNGGQAARVRGQGRGFVQHPAKLLPETAKPSKVRHNYVPPQPAPRRGVSAADYASALDQGL